MRKLRVIGFIVGTALGIPIPVQGEEFYKDKTITMGVAFSAGGDYDLRARLIARYMDRHIPGRPSIIARNMPGAGGLAASNWLAKVAPRDGTSLLMATQSTALSQAVRLNGVEYDARDFHWIGNTTDSPNLISAWAGRGIFSVDDVRRREVTVGSTGHGNGGYYYPATANAIGRTRFKIITGFPGGNDINLAMERGEVDGRGNNALASWKATKPHWLAEGKLIHVVQIGLTRHPELPNVPLLSELADTEIDRQATLLISAETAVARAIAASPGIPAGRVAMLRKAFDTTVNDPRFLIEAERLGFDISPSSGEAVQKIVTNIVNASEEVVARVRELMNVPR